jgi:hypothetical protein
MYICILHIATLQYLEYAFTEIRKCWSCTIQSGVKGLRYSYNPGTLSGFSAPPKSGTYVVMQQYVPTRTILKGLSHQIINGWK